MISTREEFLSFMEKQAEYQLEAEYQYMQEIESEHRPIERKSKFSLREVIVEAVKRAHNLEITKEVQIHHLYDNSYIVQVTNKDEVLFDEFQDERIYHPPILVVTPWTSLYSIDSDIYKGKATRLAMKYYQQITKTEK